MAQKELIAMTQKELSKYEIIKRLIRKEINGAEAAKQIGLSVRQVKNIKARVIKQGPKGVIHKSRGKPSNRKISEEKIKEIKRIIRENYHDFKPSFAAEKLNENHGIKISKETSRQIMIAGKIWKPKPRKSNKEYRAWRQRKEQYGEMIQFDGCYYPWLEGRDGSRELCLLAAMDDATGKITHLRFVSDEGVIPVFAFWKQYLEKHGKPISIYLDRFSTYKVNTKTLADDLNVLTQFERAMKDLGIRIIHANSPQAKGRIERANITLQDRLVKELRLADISTVEAANKFVEKIFISKFNAKFSVLPQKKGDIHKPLTKFEKDGLNKIFSIQNTRIVNNDFTIRFEGQWFQLSKTQPTLVLRKDKVQIEQRIDGQIFISLRGKYLGCAALPARPEKVKMKVVALTGTEPTWKPPANHPWRRQFILSKAKVEEPIAVNKNN